MIFHVPSIRVIVKVKFGLRSFNLSLLSIVSPSTLSVSKEDSSSSDQALLLFFRAFYVSLPSQLWLWYRRLVSLIC